MNTTKTVRTCVILAIVVPAAIETNKGLGLHLDTASLIDTIAVSIINGFTANITISLRSTISEFVLVQ